MKQVTSTTLLKIFIVGFAAVVLLLAGFGAGLTLGASQARRALAANDETTNVTAAPVCPPTNEAAAAVAPDPAAAAIKPATPTPAPPTATPRARAAGVSPLDLEFFDEAWELLQEQFYGELPAEGKELTYAAIRGVLDALGDEHTSFMDPDEADLFREDMEGEFEGIGARVSEAEGGGVRIEYLFPGQPAEKSGVRIGDVIVAVDDTDVTKMSLNAAISLIRGPDGTRVKLTIRRTEVDEPITIEVTRARIEITVVESRTLAEGQLEYIALAEFSSPSVNRMAEALSAAVDKKPKGIILDLRGNPGGLLDASVRIGSYLVPEGNILIERFADGDEQTYARTGRYLLNDIPLVVLVDGGSASASEIVAGAVQDAGAGILIGETTYGKGSVQLPNSMSDGSQLKITIARWFTPKDRSIDGTGLEPDIVVPLEQEDRDAKRDPQLDRAVEYLLTGK